MKIMGVQAFREVILWSCAWRSVEYNSDAPFSCSLLLIIRPVKYDFNCYTITNRGLTFIFITPEVVFGISRTWNHKWFHFHLFFNINIVASECARGSKLARGKRKEGNWEEPCLHIKDICFLIQNEMIYMSVRRDGGFWHVWTLSGVAQSHM